MASIIFMAIAVFICGIYYNVPKRSMVPIMITGAVGYFIYYIFLTYFNLRYVGLILGIMVLGFVAGFFARKLRLPTTVLFQPAIIPLVPGRQLYLMMYNIVFENYSKAADHGVRALAIAGLLAIGIYLTSFISDLIKNRIAKINRLKDRRMNNG